MEKITTTCIGICRNYSYPFQDLSLLSYGEAITTISFILAFIQFLRPILRFRVDTRFGLLITYILFFLSIIIILVSKISNTFPLAIKSLIDNSHPWFDIAPAVLIPIVMVWMVYSVTKPAKFWICNRKRYLNGCKNIIKRSIQTDLTELGEEFKYSIKEIISFCSKYNSLDEKDAKRKNIVYEISDIVNDSMDIFDVISDESFCRMLVLHNPEVAALFIKEIQTLNLHKPERNYDKWGYFFVQELIKQAFWEESSILYREKPYHQISSEPSLCELIFKNIEFLKSRFDPIHAINLINADISVLKLDKLSDITKMACNHYFSSDLFFFSTRLQISQLFKIPNSNISKQYRLHEMYKYNIPLYSIRETSSLFEGIFNKIVTETEKYNEKFSYETDKEYVDNILNSGISIHFTIVEALFDFLENLSWMKIKHDETLLYNIFYRYSESHAAKTILGKLEYKIFERLKYNLEMDAYPLITKPLLTLFIRFPLQEINGGDASWVNTFKNKFYNYVKIHFKASALKFDNASKLLPSHILYDKNKNALIPNQNDQTKSDVSIFKLND